MRGETNLIGFPLSCLHESFRVVPPPLLFRPKRQPFSAEFSVIGIHRARHPPAVRGVLVVGLGVLHGDLLNLPSRSTTPGTGVPFVLHGFVMRVGKDQQAACFVEVLDRGNNGECRRIPPLCRQCLALPKPPQRRKTARVFFRWHRLGFRWRRLGVSWQKSFQTQSQRIKRRHAEAVFVKLEKEKRMAVQRQPQAKGESEIESRPENDR